MRPRTSPIKRAHGHGVGPQPIAVDSWIAGPSCPAAVGRGEGAVASLSSDKARHWRQRMVLVPRVASIGTLFLAAAALALFIYYRLSPPEGLQVFLRGPTAGTRYYFYA